MADLIFERMNCVTLKDNENSYTTKWIKDFMEYDSEIVFETDVNIDGLKRGWVGDLFYHIDRCFDVHSGDNVDVTYAARFHDVLLARVTVYGSSGSCITWKYTFLKD